MLASLAAPSFLGSCMEGGAAAADAAGVAFALNHFKVSEEDLRKVLGAALEKGGDYADLFFEHTHYNNISLMDGAVNSTASNIDFGMGVRVLAGDQTGYAYVENITLDEMLRAARTASMMAAATGSIIAAYPHEAELVSAYAAAANLMTSVLGIYFALFVSLPVTIKIYEFFMERRGRKNA